MQINRRQKVILSAVITIVALTLLFPPFYLRGVTGVVVNHGYGFLLNPPGFNPGFADGDYYPVNIAMLLTQWFGVLIIGAIAFFLNKNK